VFRVITPTRTSIDDGGGTASPSRYLPLRCDNVYESLQGGIDEVIAKKMRHTPAFDQILQRCDELLKGRVPPNEEPQHRRGVLLDLRC
jgi:hypothetical protein